MHEEKIREVLKRYDTPGMRADLAYWYELATSTVDDIAEQLKKENNEYATTD